MQGPVDDEMVTAVRDRFMPRLQELDGFVDYYVVRGDDGGLATVSVFASREEATRSSEAAARFIREDGLSDVLPASPQIIVGEVVAHAREGAPA